MGNEEGRRTVERRAGMDRRESSMCASHVYSEKAIEELKIIVGKLTDGMGQVRESMIQLTEAFKALERVDRRLDKLELLYQEDSEKMSKKFNAIEGSLVKAGASVAAILLVVQILLSVYVK